MVTIATIDTDTFDPDFDHVYLIDGLGIIVEPDAPIWAPEVMNDPTEDVHVSDSSWAVLTGHTGQHGYNGAVMHPSEQWGDWAIRDLASRADEGHIAFCITEVRPDLDEQDNDDYSDESPIGWAVAWKRVSA